MTFIRRRVAMYDSMQVSGSVENMIDIFVWLTNLGYPALKGDVSKPETLVDPNGQKSLPGAWVNLKGELCIRTVKTTHVFDQNDWILFTHDGDIRRITHTEFNENYEVVPEA